MDKKIENLCNTPVELLKTSEKIELVHTAYDILDDEFAAEELAAMLMDSNISTSDMLRDIAVFYSKDRSSDFRNGFDAACQIFLLKSAPEIAVHLLKTAESIDER